MRREERSLLGELNPNLTLRVQSSQNGICVAFVLGIVNMAWGISASYVGTWTLRVRKEHGLEEGPVIGGPSGPTTIAPMLGADLPYRHFCGLGRGLPRQGESHADLVSDHTFRSRLCRSMSSCLECWSTSTRCRRHPAAKRELHRLEVLI